MTTNNTTPTDPEQLREEIAQTRAELGETAAALAAKADVKARTKDAAADARARAAQAATDARARAAQAAAEAKDRAAQELALTQQQLKNRDVASVARRPAPMIVLVAAASGIAALAIVLIRRARR